MFTYWTWWIGALVLSGITLMFWLSLHRTLGVSGSWARLVMWREDRFIEASERPFRDNPEMLKDALMAATIAEFGEKVVSQALAAHKLGAHSSPARQAPSAAPRSSTARAPWTAHLTLLSMLVAGGLLSGMSTGGVTPEFNLGELHVGIFGTGMGNWITLIFGGAMVGFGTQMAGGCTSGHGLSGCSRLVPASLIATAIFFGTAVAVSFLIHYAGSTAL